MASLSDEPSELQLQLSCGVRNNRRPKTFASKQPRLASTKPKPWLHTRSQRGPSVDKRNETNITSLGPAAAQRRQAQRTIPHRRQHGKTYAWILSLLLLKLCWCSHTYVDQACLVARLRWLVCMLHATVAFAKNCLQPAKNCGILTCLALPAHLHSSLSAPTLQRQSSASAVRRSRSIAATASRSAALGSWSAAAVPTCLLMRVLGAACSNDKRQTNNDKHVALLRKQVLKTKLTKPCCMSLLHPHVSCASSSEENGCTWATRRFLACLKPCRRVRPDLRDRSSTSERVTMLEAIT